MSTDFDKVKAAVAIRRYLTDQGYTIRGNRTQATCRGGKGYNVAINDNGLTWYDHKSGNGGSIIDLAMAVEGLDRAAALHALADRYGVCLDNSKPTKRMIHAPQPLNVSWVKICIFAQYGNGETQTEEIRLNADEVKCRNALTKICGSERPIPPDLFAEALALVMKKYHATKGGAR